MRSQYWSCLWQFNLTWDQDRESLVQTRHNQHTPVYLLVYLDNIEGQDSIWMTGVLECIKQWQVTQSPMYLATC